MSESQDELFTRLIERYDAQQRVDRRAPDSSGAESMTRRAFIRYGSAGGLLEIHTIAVRNDRAPQRQITWTRNVPFESAQSENQGSRLTLIQTWDEALAAING